MNPDLERLQTYPFAKLNRLLTGVTPNPSYTPIALSIGEPKQPTPQVIQEALLTHLHTLAHYPNTRGLPQLRESIATWLSERFQLTSAPDPQHQVLPVAGTREALFAFAQAIIDRNHQPVVVMPNPFYQIYEGAALLAGAQPYFLNLSQTSGYLPDFATVPEAIWQRCQLIYVCSPGNPAGAVLTESHWQMLLELADRFDFVIAADECYSEIYPDEQQPPLGLLQVCQRLGRDDFHRCVVFHSLSKRSNAPGLRSGFVAGDAKLLEAFFNYRTYHGCALPLPTQHASIAAWQDESHAKANRTAYRQRFAAVLAELDPVIAIDQPEAAFYLWLKTPGCDRTFARELYRHYHLTVLPGSFLSRRTEAGDPGQNHVRIALVPELSECVNAARRLRDFIHQNSQGTLNAHD
ncbi:MAG: succinyldiaminopimelate transaminase [Methylococcales bacterium]|nr:succinyldiaminopimelate transaminase [Methylococcales bacterium]